MNDYFDWIERFGDLAAELLRFLPFLLIFGFGPLGRLFKGDKKDAPAKDTKQPVRPVTSAPSTPPTVAMPVPDLMTVSQPVLPRQKVETTPAPTSIWGSGYSTAESRDTDNTLKWGSAFDYPSEKRDERRWKSVFDEERQPVKWGFDDQEWGSGYAKKPDSKPVIKIG